MDHCSKCHGVILFLILKFGLWNCQAAEVSFPEVNLKIQNDSLHQRLLVEFKVIKTPSKTDPYLTFNIQVARSEKMNIIADEYFNVDLLSGRNTFKWTWDSQLPLECDSHSVRIRSAVLRRVPTVEENFSEWSPWKTHHGQNVARTHTVIYPYERVVLEGSSVVFCCLPGRDQTVKYMTYDLKKMERSLDAGTDSFIVSLTNVIRTRSDGSNVVCTVEKKSGHKDSSGTVLIVSRLPDEPKNFSCLTEDLRTLRCSWNPGAIYNFYSSLRVHYVLQEGSSMKSYNCSRDHCDWPIQKDQPVYIFTLTAKNLMGERSINSVVYVNQRVLLVPPFSLRADYVTSSNITLIWSLKADYSSLQIHCQADLQGNLVNMTSKGKLKTDTYRVLLSGLHPDTQYDLRVRCMAESSLAGWSNWSNIVVRTKEDVPTGALDIWRRIKDDDDEWIVTLFWKPSPVFRANGNIYFYIIKLRPLESAHVESEIGVSAVNSTEISIGRRAYSISVTAHNKAGGSTPAELRIPANTASDTQQITAHRAYGKDGGIHVTWQQNPSVRGYVVEWCAAPTSPHCDLQWKKYNSTAKSDVIKSRDFRAGVRYEFRVYGSMEDGEHLLERTEGYTQEQVSTVTPNVRIRKVEPRAIFLDWSPYPTDGSQKGFVEGYNVYVTNTEKGCNLTKVNQHKPHGDLHVCRFYIGDPNQMELVINGLKPNEKYEVAVVAVTGGGEPAAEFKEAFTPSDTGALLRSIIVPIIAVSVLALVLLFIGCWKRAWLKRTCLPDIPDPNKSKIFSLQDTKGNLNRNIPPTANCEPQKVDRVSIQEKRQHETHEEENPPPELRQLHTIVQTTEGNPCIADFMESYVPYDNADSESVPMNEPPDESPSHLYLEFLNESYTDGLDGDSAREYRLQTSSELAPHPTYVVQSVQPQSGLHDNPVICFNGPGYEPMSPTSVGSAAPLLVD